MPYACIYTCRQSLYPFHLLSILGLNFLRYLCLNFTLQNVKLITKILCFSGTLEINCSKDIKVQGVIGPCTSLEKVGQFDHLELVLHILCHIQIEMRLVLVEFDVNCCMHGRKDLLLPILLQERGIQQLGKCVALTRVLA